MSNKVPGLHINLPSTADRYQQLAVSKEVTNKQLDPLSGKHQASDKEVNAAGQQFEAMLMQSMLKAMWATVPQNGLLSGGSEEAVYRDMFNEEMAKELAEKGGIGVAEVIAKDIKRLEKIE